MDRPGLRQLALDEAQQLRVPPGIKCRDVDHGGNERNKRFRLRHIECIGVARRLDLGKPALEFGRAGFEPERARRSATPRYKRPVEPHPELEQLAQMRLADGPGAQPATRPQHAANLGVGLLSVGSETR